MAKPKSRTISARVGIPVWSALSGLAEEWGISRSRLLEDQALILLRSENRWPPPPQQTPEAKKNEPRPA